MTQALHQATVNAMENGPEPRLQPRPALTTAKGNFAMAEQPNISIDTLRQLLEYDPDTGVLVWLPRPVAMFGSKRAASIWNARYAGKPALNYAGGGYRHGAIFNRSIKAHRVAWALHHGQWPSGVIDHINGDGEDNRISNLRDVPQEDNLRNLKRRKSNTSGVTGVSWYAPRKKWMVRVGREFIGYFQNFDEACDVRSRAARDRNFHDNHGRAGDERNPTN